MSELVMLSPLERAILDFESQPWRYPGAKETAISERFGLSAIRYYQMLNALVDDERAMAEFPMVAARLRAVRDARKRDSRPSGEVEAP